ncbi:MAG TPA: hypothetical protein VIV58_08995 [Kofleriaceae bacterium]
MRVWLVLLVACACPAKPAPITATGSATGSGSAAATIDPSNATTCEGVKPRVEALYRSEAQQKEPARVEEAVSDNTTMVMNDCTKDPGKLVPCLAKVATVGELEKTCLIPLDDEGTEGDRK